MSDGMTDADIKALVELTEEFVTATWHLLDNSETSGPVDDPTITVWETDFDEVSTLLDRCEGLPSGSTEHLTAGQLLAANLNCALTALQAERDALKARAEAAEETVGILRASREALEAQVAQLQRELAQAPHGLGPSAKAEAALTRAWERGRDDAAKWIEMVPQSLEGRQEIARAIRRITMPADLGKEVADE